MMHYTFKVQRGRAGCGGASLDAELSDLVLARETAYGLARTLMREELAAGKPLLDQRIEVEDESRHLVYILPLRFVLDWDEADRRVEAIA